jgi:hypothetical protein
MKGLPFISSFNVNQDVNIGQVCFNTISIPLTSYSPWNNNYFTQQFYTLKSIIIASRDNTNVASGSVNGFFPHSSNKFQLNQAYFRIIKSCW